MAVTLAERLPATLDLVEAGGINRFHAVAMADVVGPVQNDQLRAEIEQELLENVGAKTPAGLRVAAKRVVAERDAKDAAERMVSAIRDRRVRWHDGDDGMGSLVSVLTGPTGQACYKKLDALAHACKTEDDERTHQQRMADCLVDLILRPGENGLPSVQIALTLVASLETMLGGDQPGEVEGSIVPAAMVRELAYAFGLLPRPAPQSPAVPDAHSPTDDRGVESDTTRGADTDPDVATDADTTPRAVGPPSEPSGDPPTGSGDDVPDERAGPFARPIADRQEEMARAADRATTGDYEAMVRGRWTDGEARALLDLGALLNIRTVTDTPLARRPHLAIVDRMRGTLVALTDATAIARGEALGPPPETDGYKAGAALDRFVRLRDRRCRFPGCRARPRYCDLDHQCPYPHGPTAHDNLCCLCESHHRLSHQAPGWSMWRTGDCGLAWRSPDGEITVTYPPGFGRDDDLPAGHVGDDPPAGPVGDDLPAGPVGDDPPAGDVDEDPPPF
jgi:hypothetical protein